MIVLGLILMLIGFLLSVPVLWTLGIVLAVIGAVLWCGITPPRPAMAGRHDADA